MNAREKLNEDVINYCKKYNLKSEFFFVASISNSVTMEYNWIKNKHDCPPDGTKYVIRFFTKYNLVVIWNRFEKISSTKKLTLPNECKNYINSCYLSGTEYGNWHKSDVYVCKMDFLEKAISQCNNKIYQYKREMEIIK